MHNLMYSQASTGPIVRRAYTNMGTRAAANRFFRIQLSVQPEGVWLATSGDIPGLFVEGDTLEEARAEALAWGRELLADNLGLDPDQGVVFVFNDGEERTYVRP